jgi:hypothetical protein
VDIRAAVNVFERNQIISSTQSDVNIYNDGYVKLFIPIVVKAEHRYTVEVTMHNLITGNQAARTATIVGR